MDVDYGIKLSYVGTSPLIINPLLMKLTFSLTR